VFDETGDGGLVGGCYCNVCSRLVVLVVWVSVALWLGVFGGMGLGPEGDQGERQ
jgi:hypothetical protein